MKMPWILLLVIALFLSACSKQPACSVASGDMGVPSAGCLAVDDGELLLVKIMGGTYGPPGGSVYADEPAQCTAERETWEETGVQVKAGDLAAEFDNGFRLYWCSPVAGREIEISRPIEIQHADWYPPELFQHLKWRYANQADIIQTLMDER
jgi:8-oxo-dGTP diphosphatase